MEVIYFDQEDDAKGRVGKVDAIGLVGKADAIEGPRAEASKQASVSDEWLYSEMRRKVLW